MVNWMSRIINLLEICLKIRVLAWSNLMVTKDWNLSETLNLISARIISLSMAETIYLLQEQVST